MDRLVDFVSEDIRSFLHLCTWKVYLICVTVLRFLRCYWKLIFWNLLSFGSCFDWIVILVCPVFQSLCAPVSMIIFIVSLFVWLYLLCFECSIIFSFALTVRLLILIQFFTSFLSLLVFDYLQLRFVPTALSSPINIYIYIYMLWTNSPKNSSPWP